MFRRLLLACLDQVIEAGDGQLWVCASELVNILLLDLVLAVVDDVLDILGFFEGVDKMGEEVGIKVYGMSIRLHQRMLQALFTEGVVCCDDWH